VSRSDFTGQWNPPCDQVLESNFFPKGLPPSTMVEAGAGDGLTESNGLYFEERGWKCINIEPDRTKFRWLCGNRPKATNWCVALSDINDGQSIDFYPGPRADKTAIAPRRTWASMVDEFELKSVELFVLDVEGQELRVIEGMRGACILPDVICAEYPWPTTGLGPLCESLASLNYHFLFTSWNNAFFSKVWKPGPYFGATREYLPGELG
jgi:hypothetical protein